MYATHSPLFIDPSNYQQVRRLHRVTGGEHPDVCLRILSEEQLRTALDGHVDKRSIARRGTTRYVKDLAEALFSDVAVLVEGVTDEAVLLAFAEHQGRNLGAASMCVLSAEGKDNMMLCHAILTGFGVRCYLVFDADAGPKKAPGDAKPQHTAANMKILGYLGARAVPRPATASEAESTVFEDDLETYRRDEWPAWSARCRELTTQEAGYVEGKHVPTYAEAARTASGEPELLHALLENVWAMSGRLTPGT